MKSKHELIEDIILFILFLVVNWQSTFGTFVGSCDIPKIDCASRRSFGATANTLSER